MLLFISVLSVVVFYNPEKPVKIRADQFNRSISRQEISSLFSSRLAKVGNSFVLGTSTPIEVAAEGEIKKANFDFNAVGTSWIAEIPEGSEFRVQLRFSKDGKNWSDWEDVEEEEDGPDKEKSTRKFGRIVFNQADFFQEKLIFKTNDPDSLPNLENLRFTYLDSEEKNNLLEKILKKIKLTAKQVFAAETLPKNATDKPTICSRACWGADESIYVPGEEYVSVKKIIIHHTVTTNNDPNPAATVRAIYYFHAIDRGWGDIGYNFLVDQNNGTIYEGRYGGDDVVGAHARGYNYGSVGIGVLGDFRYASPNKKVQNALHKLVTWKVYSRNLNPEGVSTFGSPAIKLPNISFHGYVNQTECPGKYLISFVPNLRAWAYFLPQQILLRKGSTTARIEGANDKTVTDLLNSYRSQGSVAPNYVRNLWAFPSDGVTAPNDDEYSNQWDFAKLEGVKVWKETVGGSASVKVALLDTGVAYENYNPAGEEHYDKAPDFEDTNFAAGYDFVNNDSRPNDDHGHGTLMASIVAETTNNSEGSAALASNVSIMPIKVCDYGGWCTDNNIVQGIKFARQNGAKILNMSFGHNNYSPVVHEEIVNAKLFGGVLSIVAAGNSGSSSLSYPASDPYVLSVGALTSSDTRSAYSNFGKGLDLTAPGGDNNGGDPVYQTLSCTGKDCTTFEYKKVAGTSISTALVSASAALVLSEGFEGAGNIESILISTATDLGSSGYDSTFGFGRVNPLDAVTHPNVGGYLLDGWGGIHNFGKTVERSPSGYWSGWDIARAITLLPDGSGGFTLDGWGGLHNFGAAVNIPNNSHMYWQGWDIARDVVLLPSSTASAPKGYILDGWGGLQAFGGAPTIPNNSHTYWKGWDIAKAVVLKSDGSGGYILDGWGGLHNFGTASPIAHNSHAYWKGWNIARDVVLLPGTESGYILDGYGGVHPFGGAPNLSTSAYWPGWDIARSIALSSDGTKGYVLDGWGGIHALGSTPRIYKQNYSYWPGWNIARSFVLK